MGEWYDEVDCLSQNSLTDMDRIKRVSDWVMKHSKGSQDYTKLNHARENIPF